MIFFAVRYINTHKNNLKPLQAMKTIEIKLYSFEELSEDAQKKAIEASRDMNTTDYDWYTYAYDDHRERMEEIGIEVTEIYFSGFWSQGDGAMFECKIDIQKLIKTLHLENNYDQRIVNLIEREHISLYGQIKHYGHYYHEKSYYSSLDFEFMTDHNSELERINEVLTEIYDDILELYEDKCRELYKMLERDYEHLTSDECIKESLIVNEYDFTEEGEIY